MRADVYIVLYRSSVCRARVMPELGLYICARTIASIRQHANKEHSEKDLKKAYLRRSIRLHPDKCRYEEQRDDFALAFVFLSSEAVSSSEAAALRVFGGMSTS